MFKLLQSKTKRFWLIFSSVFIATVFYQMAINGVFAKERVSEEKQFVVQVSGSGKPVILIPGLMSSSAPTDIGPIISVDGLPFIGPVFTRTNATTVESLAGQAQQIKSMYNNMSQQQLIQQSRYGLSIQASSDEAKQQVMSMVETSDTKTVGDAIYTLMRHDLRQVIANITSPVLLLGASGGFSTDEQKTAMQTLYAQQLVALPSAELRMNTDSRHFVMLDDPMWLEEQVLTFLGTHL